MLKLFPEGLAPQLEQVLAPYYLLCGQDLLLLGEAKDAIIATARRQDFDEKIEITVANDTRWDDLFDLMQSNGLFSNRRILLLNLPENFTAAQQKQLTELLAFSHSDILLLLTLPKLAKTMERAAWFKQLSAGGAVQVNCQTPDISRLPIWLNRRVQGMKLFIEQDAAQFLCYSYEGNLLAFKQALQMLQLRFPDGKITLPRAQEIVEQSSQYTPFQWVDALLAGKHSRAVHIVQQLKNEEVQAVVLLRIIQKELFLLLELTRAPYPLLCLDEPLFSGNLRAEFDRLKVWQNKRALYQNAVARLTYRKLFRLIGQLADLERKIKQEFSDTVWDDLELLSARFLN